MARQSAAIKKYEAIVQAGNANVDTWIKLGEAYNAAGDYEKAIKCLDKASLESYEEKYEVPILTLLADVYPKVGDFEKEAETYMRLLKKIPKEPYVWRKAARAYERIGKTQEARICYSRAMNLSPRDPNLLYHYSFFCEKSDQADNAIAASPPMGVLNDREYDVRMEAVDALDEIGGASVIPALSQALKDEDSNVRWEAAETLGKIGNPCAIPALALALRDKDWFIRDEAAQALGKIGNASTLILTEALRDKEWSIREKAAEALGEIGDASVVSNLVEVLSDADGDVRTKAVVALGEIGDASSVPALTQTLKDADRYVREAAAEALRKINNAR